MVEISRRNPGECIEGKDDAIAYLNAAAETGDPTLLQVAIQRTRRPHRRRIHVHRCEWDPHQRQQGWPIQGERQGIEDHRKG